MGYEYAFKGSFLKKGVDFRQTHCVSSTKYFLFQPNTGTLTKPCLKK